MCARAGALLTNRRRLMEGGNIVEFLFKIIDWLIKKQHEGELSIWKLLMLMACTVFAGYIGWHIAGGGPTTWFNILLTLAVAFFGFLIGLGVLWIIIEEM